MCGQQGAGTLTHRGELLTPRAATSSGSWTLGVRGRLSSSSCEKGNESPPLSQWLDPAFRPQWNTLASHAVERRLPVPGPGVQPPSRLGGHGGAVALPAAGLQA